MVEVGQWARANYAHIVEKAVQEGLEWLRLEAEPFNGEVSNLEYDDRWRYLNKGQTASYRARLSETKNGTPKLHITFHSFKRGGITSAWNSHDLTQALWAQEKSGTKPVPKQDHEALIMACQRLPSTPKAAAALGGCESNHTGNEGVALLSPIIAFLNKWRVNYLYFKCIDAQKIDTKNRDLPFLDVIFPTYRTYKTSAVKTEAQKVVTPYQPQGGVKNAWVYHHPNSKRSNRERCPYYSILARVAPLLSLGIT